MQFQSSTNKLTDLLPVIVVAIAWWLLTRPYHGIWHDGLLYTVQALRRLHPEQYAQDVFFLYGSQDDYTPYSFFQAWLVEACGTEAAFMALTLSGGALWLYALLRLLHRWLSPSQLILAATAALTAEAQYGGFDVFAVGESFATPRIFSEALVLLALPPWLSGRRVIACGFLAGAAVLHPLIALAGIGVFLWSALTERVTRAAVAWILLFGLGLSGLQLSIWLGYSPQLDPLWRQLIAQRSPFIFPYLWELSDWLRVLLDGLLLWLASRYLAGEAGKLACWIMAVLALGILLSLSAGAMEVQLAIAAQVHRVQWLAHLMAIALTVPLALNLWQRADSHHRLMAAGVAGSLIFPFSVGGLVLPAVYALLLWSRSRLGVQTLPRPLYLAVLIGIPLIAVVAWLFWLLTNLTLVQLFTDTPVWRKVMVQMPVALSLPLSLYALTKRPDLQRAMLWAYGMTLMAIAVPTWDERKPWRIYELAARTAAILEVAELIPRQSVVYWESSTFVNPEKRVELAYGNEFAWLWLRRSHYASFQQAAGDVFHRETAAELSRRVAHLRRWGFRDGNPDWYLRKKTPEKLRLTEARLRGVCSDPILDFVITDTKLPSASLRFQDPLTVRKFSVYDCRKLRST